MKEIRTQDAIGHIISHDITRIIPGGEKSVAFKKGHVVREEDVGELLKIGKSHLFVWENDGSLLHENEAAQILADLVVGTGFRKGEVKEGKIEVFADKPGLLRVDKEKLAALNAFDEVMVAARHDLCPVKKGDKLCGTRIIPLAISWERMDEVARAVGVDPAKPADADLTETTLSVIQYKKMRAAIVTTGSEVFEGLIEDGFTPIVREKLDEFDAEVIGNLTVPDNPDMTTSAIMRMIEKGADVVFVTGGMSVDPDDRTPLAIKNTGAKIVSYGAPVLPGAMFMMAYLGDTAILGLPGCVMHSKRTILDIILPRVMAGLRVTKEDIIALAPGGLCLSCEVCNFPACGFGAV